MKISNIKLRLAGFLSLASFALGFPSCSFFNSFDESPKSNVIEINSISLRWFMTTVSDLPVSKKARLIPYVYHTIKTTVPQLARGFGIPREEISRLIDSSSR